MPKNILFRLLVVVFILAATLTFILPSKLMDFFESGPSISINPDALPLTDFLPSRKSVGDIQNQVVPIDLRQPILVYHHVRPRIPEREVYKGLEVAPQIFAEQMNWLKENEWKTITLSEYVDALEGKIKIPPRSAVLTFDDGNRNQYEYALPILKENGHSATFFIYPNAIGRRDDFMNWNQLKDLAEAGMEIGSHSLTHPRLYKMTDLWQVRREVSESKAWLERELGVKVDTFAYPFGEKGELDEQAVKDFGYRAARIYPYGQINTLENRFGLKSVSAPDSLSAFIKIMERSWR